MRSPIAGRHTLSSCVCSLSQTVFIRLSWNCSHCLTMIISISSLIAIQIAPGTHELQPFNCSKLTKLVMSALEYSSDPHLWHNHWIYQTIGAWWWLCFVSVWHTSFSSF